MSSAPHIQAGDWIDRQIPAPVRPYLRLARIHAPIGTWLLLFPGWWSLTLAAAPGDLPDGWMMVLFGVGALVMRAAGCTVNDIVDRDFDAQVARTANRPLASGALSRKQALVFLALLLLGELPIHQLGELIQRHRFADLFFRQGHQLVGLLMTEAEQLLHRPHHRLPLLGLHSMIGTGDLDQQRGGREPHRLVALLALCVHAGLDAFAEKLLDAV